MIPLIDRVVGGHSQYEELMVVLLMLVPLLLLSWAPLTVLIICITSVRMFPTPQIAMKIQFKIRAVLVLAEWPVMYTRDVRSATRGAVKSKKCSTPATQ